MKAGRIACDPMETRSAARSSANICAASTCSGSAPGAAGQPGSDRRFRGYLEPRTIIIRSS